MKNTQLQMIIKKLSDDGFVSRNWALSRFCSRLGAIINRLNNDGWEIKGEFVQMEYGKDFVYKVLKAKELTLFR